MDDCVSAYADGVGHHGCVLDGSVVVGLQIVEDELVGFEEVLGLACVLPPALHLLDGDTDPVGEECLDGVGNLEFSPPGGFYLFDGIEDLVVEDVDADEGPVADRFLGLLHESFNTPSSLKTTTP